MLLPASWQKLHDSLPTTSSKCHQNYSHDSAAGSDIMLSACFVVVVVVAAAAYMV
jgi:hypothetical protein